MNLNEVNKTISNHWITSELAEIYGFHVQDKARVDVLENGNQVFQGWFVHFSPPGWAVEEMDRKIPFKDVSINGWDDLKQYLPFDVDSHIWNIFLTEIAKEVKKGDPVASELSRAKDIYKLSVESVTKEEVVVSVGYVATYFRGKAKISKESVQIADVKYSL